ncbi:THAP domain-containing protein 1-like [Dendronephthya gigantea]|uniref:THAP domain-containing protein 1-like n=1 Tax=Dendronephthya gigantea TaxID=151771 RepID=UPI0010697278|nr:THAP domain-containing protein 1-like [Dendronephthya gigantea]
MPRRCVVYGCANTADTSNGISIYEIPFWGENTPIAAKRRAKWINFVHRKRDKWMPTPSSVVCSQHFTEDCFQFGSDVVKKYKTPRLKRDEHGICVYPTIDTKLTGAEDSERTKHAKQRAISKPSKLDEEEAPTTSSDILSDEPGPMEQERIPAEELEHSQNCSSCELLKKENKRIRSCWQTSKQKLSAVREELRALRSVTGESSHAQVLDDDIESDNEECSVSEDEAEEPSDEVSEDVEIETETTDTDTDEDINVPPRRIPAKEYNLRTEPKFIVFFTQLLTLSFLP